MPRLFVAIEIPEAIKAQLVSLPRDIEGAKWVRDAQLHLTLRFIGEVGDALAADVESALAEVVAPPFELQLERAGTFGSKRAPRILWVGVSRSDPLGTLQSYVECAVQAGGIAPESREFRPHLTIARMKKPDLDAVTRFVEAVDEESLPPWTVEHFTLFSSVLSNQGATHTAVRRYPLRLPA